MRNVFTCILALIGFPVFSFILMKKTSTGQEGLSEGKLANRRICHTQVP